MPGWVGNPGDRGLPGSAAAAAAAATGAGTRIGVRLSTEGVGFAAGPFFCAHEIQLLETRNLAAQETDRKLNGTAGILCGRLEVPGPGRQCNSMTHVFRTTAYGAGHGANT